MADFCSLCGYKDIDINDLYERHIKSTLLEDIEELDSDGKFISVNVGGICEHCGIVAFGVNNKLEVWGGYYEGNSRQLGYIDETLNLIISEVD